MVFSPLFNVIIQLCGSGQSSTPTNISSYPLLPHTAAGLGSLPVVRVRVGGNTSSRSLSRLVNFPSVVCIFHKSPPKPLNQFLVQNIWSTQQHLKTPF